MSKFIEYDIYYYILILYLFLEA